MANNGTLESIKSIVNNPALAEAMAHPDWDDAFEKTLSNFDLPFRQKDVDDDVTFMFILTQFSFYVEDGKLWCDCCHIPCDPAFWRDGEWVEEGDEEDEED